METESEISDKGPIRLDVGQIIKSRLGRSAPRCITDSIAKIIHQNDLNALLAHAWPRRGVDFCESVIEHLGIDVCVKGAANLPASPRAVFISNHPLGGLDGMTLIMLIGKHYKCEPLFVVNDLLMAVEPLRDVFLPINKHGAQSKDSLMGIDAGMASDRPLIIFPAGMCSRRRNGAVTDLEWKKMFIQKAHSFGRDIVPMHFDAQNSSLFYNFSNIREKLGIKFNAEMILLPREIFRAAHSKFTVTIGKPVAIDTLSGPIADQVSKMRRLAYALKNNNL